MQLRLQSKQNLERDGKVLGNAWKKTYKGYFGNKNIMRKFIQIILPYVPTKKKSISILYPASANGELGELLAQTLQKRGIHTNLTIFDISKKHLLQNHNSKTKKIHGDWLSLKLKKKFDVIIIRSSLDYFSNEKMQVRALKKIKGWLEPQGVFFNQAASLSNRTERDLANRIYASNSKIGKRHFQCEDDIARIYFKTGFAGCKKIGIAPVLWVSEKEHAQRYSITSKEVARIQRLITRVPSRKRKNIKVTKQGYRMRFLFPIYLDE